MTLSVVLKTETKTKVPVRTEIPCQNHITCTSEAMTSYNENSSWDSIGDAQYCSSDSTVNLRVALSIEMKNRQPSILYSSRGFLWPKLLTFTCHTSDISLWLLRKLKGSKKARRTNKLPLN